MPQVSVCRVGMNWRVVEPVGVIPLFLGAAFVGGIAVSIWSLVP